MTGLAERAAVFAASNPGARHNPYDTSTWGSEYARGFQTFKDSGGTHITSGTRRKFTRNGVKVRAMSSDTLK